MLALELISPDGDDEAEDGGCLINITKKMRNQVLTLFGVGGSVT